MNVSQFKRALKNAGLGVVVFAPDTVRGDTTRRILVDGLAARLTHDGATVTRLTFEHGPSIDLTGLTPMDAATSVAGALARMHGNPPTSERTGITR